MEPFICATTRSLDLDVGVRMLILHFPTQSSSLMLTRDNLEGQKPPIPVTTLLEHPELKHVGSNTSPHSDLYVTVQVYADNKPLTVPVQTAYKSFKKERQYASLLHEKPGLSWSNTITGRWLEWLRMPIRYRDLPLSAQLAITVWDLAGPLETVPFGGTTIKLFEKDNTLKKGRQKCKIWLGKEADGRTDSTTPSPVESNDEMDRLEKVGNAYHPHQ